jgi:hypothetical protein
VKEASGETGRSASNLLDVSREMSMRATELDGEFQQFVAAL